MAWEVFTKPLEENDAITPKHMEELWNAFDERVKAVCDDGAKVFLENLTNNYVSLMGKYDSRIFPNDDTRERIEPLALAINSLSSSSSFSPQGYLYDLDGKWVRFSGDVNSTRNVGFVAAKELGYTDTEAFNIISDFNRTDPHVAYRSIHQFNIIRKSLQLMRYPQIPIYTDEDRLLNNLDGSSESELVKNEHDGTYEGAKDEFFNAVFSKSPGFGSISLRTSVSSSGSSFNVRCTKFILPLKLHSVWAKGYKLFYQYRTFLGSIESWQNAELQITYEGQEAVSRVLTSEGLEIVETITDKFEEENPTLDDTIEGTFNEIENRSALDAWPEPDNDNSAYQAQLLTRDGGETSASPFFGKVNFDFGDDPE